MKLFINHLDKTVVESKLENLKHIDFSLFIDDIPKSNNDLSPINILVLQEPNEYFGLHDWAIQNKDLFSFILTWDDKILNTCENSIFLPFGHTWFKSEQYEISHTKKFQISHLCGRLLKTYGQSIRHEILNRKSEIHQPLKFYDVYGDRHNIDTARKDKEFIFGDSMFGIAIENTSHNGYFTEKILDCFATGTIPVYMGTKKVAEYFNPDGIIFFDGTFDVNTLTEELYQSKMEAIKDNYDRVQKYSVLDDWIFENYLKEYV